MSKMKRAILIVLLVPLMGFVVFMQGVLDPQRAEYQPGRVTDIDIGTEFLAATLIGLKEVVAGVLWVRADEFFHTGNYAAVIPIVRIVTWLDPHQIDVYDTGGWHLAYNFTDSQERSDRRYIPPSKALYLEGIANNPDIFDLYFNYGWMHYQKILDFPGAVTFFQEANRRDSVDPASGRTVMRPQYVGHMLAHGLTKAGRIDEAIEQWRQNVQDNIVYAEQYAQQPGEEVMIQVAQNNLERMLQERERRLVLQPTRSVNFDAHWQYISPRKFRVWGTLDLPTGARVRLVLRDKEYKEEHFERFSWDIDTNQTILIDDLYVRDGEFSRIIDIERDASVYPLVAEEYVMTFSFDPLNAPDFVQDEIGWHGNGLADQPYLVEEDGIRRLQKSFTLTRSQIL